MLHFKSLLIQIIYFFFKKCNVCQVNRTFLLGYDYCFEISKRGNILYNGH